MNVSKLLPYNVLCLCFDVFKCCKHLKVTTSVDRWGVGPTRTQSAPAVSQPPSLNIGTETTALCEGFRASSSGGSEAENGADVPVLETKQRVDLQDSVLPEPEKVCFPPPFRVIPANTARSIVWQAESPDPHRKTQTRPQPMLPVGVNAVKAESHSETSMSLQKQRGAAAIPSLGYVPSVTEEEEDDLVEVASTRSSEISENEDYAKQNPVNQQITCTLAYASVFKGEMGENTFMTEHQLQLATAKQKGEGKRGREQLLPAPAKTKEASAAAVEENVVFLEQ